jgi:hypothetical protein
VQVTTKKATVVMPPTCCGECSFYQEVDKVHKCWVDPPAYMYGDEDDKVYDRGKPVHSTDPKCWKFIARSH